MPTNYVNYYVFHIHPVCINFIGNQNHYLITLTLTTERNAFGGVVVGTSYVRKQMIMQKV